jgi:hypothetical protein
MEAHTSSPAPKPPKKIPEIMLNEKQNVMICMMVLSNAGRY